MTDEVQFRDSLTTTLEQLSHLGKALQKKCSALIQQNASNIELDINSIEYVALKLVKTLRKTKGNILALLSFLEDDIKQLNATCQTSLFQEVVTKIQECRTCTVVIENGNAIFKQAVDKGVMVTVGGVMVNQDVKSTKTVSTSQIVGPHSHDEDEEDVKFICESMPETKMFNLSLRKKTGRSDTEDTDDFWEDILSRKEVKKEINSGIESTIISSCSLELKEERHSEETDKDAPVSEKTSHLSGAVLDLKVDPNITHKNTEDNRIQSGGKFSISDVVKVAERLHQDAGDVEDGKLVESEYHYASEDSEVVSEHDVEDSKANHVDGLPANDDGDDSDSVWSNETVVINLEEANKMDEADGCDDGGSRELKQTQTVRANAIEETGEHPNDEPIAEVSPNRTEANDEDEEVDENAKTAEALILENDDSISAASTSHEATHISQEHNPLDTKEQGNESNEKGDQEIQQQGDRIPDEHSNSKSTKNNDAEAKPPNQCEEEEILWGLNLSSQGGSLFIDNASNIQMVEGSSSDVTDIGTGDMNDAKSLNDKHEEKDICEKNCIKKDMKFQSQEHMENKETCAAEREPSEADDIDIDDEEKLHDDEITAIDSIMDIIIIDDDSSDDVESQKDLHMECGPKNDLEEVIAGSRPVAGTPSNSEEQLGEQDDDLKDTDIQGLSTKANGTQLKNISNMALARPDVEGDAPAKGTKELEDNTSVQGIGIDKVSITPSSNSENNAKLPEETSMENLSGLDVADDGSTFLKGSQNIEKSGEAISEKELGEQECVAVGAIDVEKNKSSSWNTYACEDILGLETVTYDIEEALSKSNIEGSTIQANNKHNFEQADVDHINAHHEEKEVDSDATYIEGSEGTSKSQNEQNPTVTVDHMTENYEVVSEIAEKNVSHSSPGSKLSDCDSFIFDVKACSQTGSFDEKGSGAEDNLKQADETVVSKDMGNDQSSRCDMKKRAVPDENFAASNEQGREEANLEDKHVIDISNGDIVNKQLVVQSAFNEVASAESGERHSDDRQLVMDKVVSDFEADNEDSQLVDVIMEEILESSDKSAEDFANYSQALKMETKLSVKVEPKVEEADPEEDEESEEEPEEKVAGVDQLGDELLELFRKVDMSKDSDEHAYAKNPEKTEDDSDTLSDYESDDAEAIFKAMEQDSTDTTDSDNVDDGDISILDDSDIEMPVESQEKQSAHNENSELKQNIMLALHLKERKMDRCYVRVERVDLETLSKTWRSTAIVDDSIDRLCDLSTLNKNACSGETNEQSKSCHRKKRKKRGQSSDQTENLIDSSSSSNSDVEVWNRSSSAELGSDAERRLNIMLAKAAMKVMGEDSTDSESKQTHEEGERKRKKKKKSDSSEAEEAVQVKLTEEERAKKKWRNDKLLREKLGSSDSSDSSISSDSRGSSRKKRRVKKKYEDEDPDYKLDFSESSGEERRRKGMSHKDESSNKSDLSDSDSSVVEQIKLDDTTDNDSDVEFVFKDVASTSSELTPTQKGHRRNIRALMSDADLEEATLRAKEAEEERIGRLKSKQKLRESLSQCLSQSLSGTLSATNGVEGEGMKEDEEEEALNEGLVLDVDENTNKPLVQVDPQLTKILKSHQKSGIQFMWDCCYESLERIKAKDTGSGCILAHCMGLGKTLQVLTLIHTLFAYKGTGAKHALVVCPLSTVSNWKKEAKLRLKDVKKNFEVFTIGSTHEIGRQKPIIKQWYCAKRSILIMGYERYECLTNEEKLNKLGAEFKTLLLNALVDPGPDLIVCDEGHLLKSKKAVKVQALNKVRTKRRIVLTGTPLQNNLIEYYHMVQFVKPNLLGNLKEFKTNFVNPITNGQYEDSTKEDIKLMKKRTHVLHNYLKQTIQRFEDTELQTYLKKMHHYAVFVQLHPVQVEFYKKFLDITFMAQREEERKTRNHKGFLSDFAVFQYICTHPYLLKVMDNKRNNNDREQDVIITDDDRPLCNIGKWWKDGMPPDAENNIEYGTKLLVVKHILEECEEIGDKVLIFSQSLGELDLIEHFLKNCGTSKCPSWKKDVDYTRMDGTVKPESRSGICDRFNEKSNTKLRLLLISIRVGGLGLNLTAANRVITMTVSWNPSYDLQSVFRVYRFGQEKAVYVYRLIAMDTMEEKAYQRTVTKLAVAHRVIDKYQIKRHYKSVDLQAMYSCFPTADNQRPTPNVPEDEVLAKLILKLHVIYKFHEQQALLANRPEDDLNEQEKIAAWEEFEKEKNAQKAAKEAAAMAATFAKEAVAASAEAMAALAATSKDLTKTRGPVPITSWGPTFNMAYSLCPPSSSSSSGAKGDYANNVAHAEAINRNGQLYDRANKQSTGGNVDHLTKNDTMKNNSGQVDVAKNATQENFGNKNTPPVDLKFTKALGQLLKLNTMSKNTGMADNRKQQNPIGGHWGSPNAHPRPLQQNLIKQRPSRPKLSQHVDETPIDLTVDKGRDVRRSSPKDPLATSSNGTNDAASPLQHSDWYHKSMEWMDRQKASLIEHMKCQNQKENQQQVALPKTRLSMKSLRTCTRNCDVDAVSKMAQMDHAYSATSDGVKRKSDDHSTAGSAVKKKRKCSSLMRLNPCALLQPASAQAVAAAGFRTGAALSGTVVDLSDDEVEVVETPSSATSPPAKPHHDDIINTLCRSGVTVTLAPADTRTASNDVITLD